ncbi:hypothetical protein BLL52_1090 [Rhodoferax antarcticus ANT.BR]|uniref:Uncharacterized protein n=1 Tax=Rhodoferax antarcticus ANT.BR TaxID=1111071 RepID=A0A1Q8YH91_9BURK|nr:hypothetical protein BLL52_1090 [Rhodoferax antarcticus ANT.BR]
MNFINACAGYASHGHDGAVRLVRASQALGGAAVCDVLQFGIQ